ncbi:MAG: SHOCT domain-containing protein [Chloroflexi bacterium]|nr:SHOCT domain-containing protein [Chloroflexota bacterium]
MPGLIRGVARTAVIAGTATAVSNRVSRRQAGRWAEQDQAQYQQAYAQQPVYEQPPPGYGQQPVYAQAAAPPAPAPPEVPAAAPVDDMSAKLAHLQQLGELKAQGILSEEEFEAQKAKILAS